MVKRRVIRVLVAPSRTSYWLNGARQTGVEYELLKAFEKEINEKYTTQGRHIRSIVAIIPTRPDQLISGLLEGRGDIAAGLRAGDFMHQVPIDVQDRRPVFLDVNDVIVPKLVVQFARSGHARKNRAGEGPASEAIMPSADGRSGAQRPANMSQAAG